MKKLWCILTLLMCGAAFVFTACSQGTETTESVEKYSITFDANGGLFPGGAAVVTVEDNNPRPVRNDFPLPPTRDEGFFFNNWWTTSDTGGRRIVAETNLAPSSAAVTVYARWLEVPAGSWVVTFDYNNDTSKSLSMVIANGQPVGSEMPAAPVRGGYVFLGWFSAREGGTEYTSATAINAETKLYARWRITAREDVEAAVASAKLKLADLSTVTANLTLPASDDAVEVSWSSSDTAVLSDKGTVSRPTGSPATLTLTGTFTSLMDSATKETFTWNVRVLHTGAAFNDYLNVCYVVDEGAFKNTAPSGAYYTPTLNGGATVNSTVAAYPVIDLGASGYIDLGPKVGALLLKPQWTVEILIRTNTADTGHSWAFANSDTATTRGTVFMQNNALTFGIRTSGTWNANVGSGQNASPVWTSGGSGGLGNTRRYAFTYITLVRNGNYIAILRNGTQAQNNENISFSQLGSNALFTSGDDSLEPLRFGYIGKNPVNFTGPAMSGARVYSFKVWSAAKFAYDGSKSPAWNYDKKVDWAGAGTASNATNFPDTYALKDFMEKINAAYSYSIENGDKK